MAVRLKDIAHELGLSVVTISKVLRNHPDISEETRKRVLARMKELKYRPNIAARSLITGKSWSIGLIVPDLLHPFFAQIAKAISTNIRKQGYSLILASSEEDPELEQQEVEQLLARQVDVILIASSQVNTESFAFIEERGTPYILLDRWFDDLEASFIGVDDRAVGRLATSHLLEQGCKRIAHIRGPEVSTAQGRLEGYKEALWGKGLKPMPGFIVSIGTSGDDRGDKAAYDATMKLLAMKPRPDGIFCFNDPIALGTMKAILDSGLRIPEDIAVVGCGNVLYSDFLRVPLSTIDQNSQIIGERAAKLALAMASAKGSTRAKKELISPGLVVRASSLRKKAGSNKK